MIRIAAEGIAATFDPDIGMIAGAEFREGGRCLAPFHAAPWVGAREPLPEDIAPHLARLGGDFFCAPFAAVDGASPLHGWPANASWTVDLRPDGLAAVLDRPVMGARLTKTVQLRDGHPFLYQRHVFEGGDGAVSVANHANIAVPEGALISTSRKTAWQTPADPLESDPARGRSRLRYPARSDDPTAFPAMDGDVDLTRFPWGPCHEDLVIGLEAQADGLGWTAVVRLGRGDVYLSCRSPAELPMTMLWHSNGGRDYAPWSARHFGCLGVEEGAARHVLPEGAAGELCAPGAVVLKDGGRVSVDHVVGAIAWPSEERVTDVRAEGDQLIVTGARSERRVKFDGQFLAVTRR